MTASPCARADRDPSERLKMPVRAGLVAVVVHAILTVRTDVVLEDVVDDFVLCVHKVAVLPVAAETPGKVEVTADASRSKESPSDADRASPFRWVDVLAVQNKAWAEFRHPTHARELELSWRTTFIVLRLTHEGDVGDTVTVSVGAADGFSAWLETTGAVEVFAQLVSRFDPDVGDTVDVLSSDTRSFRRRRVVLESVVGEHCVDGVFVVV